MSDLLAYLSPSWRDEALQRLQSELPPEKMNNVTTSMSNIYKNCPGGDEQFLFVECRDGKVTRVETGSGEPPQAEFRIIGDYETFAKISRAELGAQSIKVFADVDKKHSVRFPGIDLRTHVEWTRFFGADALIVSGRMTGDAPDLGKVREARVHAGETPLLVGSGATAENVAAFLSVADGVIVGSSIKAEGRCENPVDVERVKRFVAAARTDA